MKQTPIFDLLYAQSQHARIRFCMPGHKGTLDPCDVTEAGEMDNLLHPAGALKQAHACLLYTSPYKLDVKSPCLTWELHPKL